MPSKEDIATAIVQKSLVIPQSENSEETIQQVGIIKGLSTENDLVRIQLRLMGLSYDYFNRRWVQIRKPLMNYLGIGNFMASLQALGDLANFSYYETKDIPKLACLFFEDNYPTFILYSQEYELDPKDFNVVNSILKWYPLSVLNNAKNAGHRNVVRGTLSENLLQRAFGNGESQKKPSIIDRLFKRNKGENK
jgi:hypothetical protein